MKAEHRKELQTNVLADRMGKLVQRMKERPKKRVVLYVILGAVILGGLFIFSRIRSASALEESDHWSWLEDGFKLEMDKLIFEYPDTNAGKGARYQYAWLALWDVGLKTLAADPVDVLKVRGEIDDKPGNLEVAEINYLKLKKNCEGDPIWESEAMYALAVIEETRAIRLKGRDEHLKEALRRYKELAEKYKTSARGKQAQKWAEVLEKKMPEIVSFYDDLNTRLDIEKRFFESKKKFK